MKTFFLYLIILCIPALLAPVESYAAGTARPISIQSVYNKSASSAKVDVLQKYTGVEAANDRYVSSVVTLGAASLGKLAVKALKYAGPAGLLVSAAMDLTGMQVDTDAFGEIQISPYYWHYIDGTAAGYFFYQQTHASCLALPNGRCTATNVGAIAQYITDNATQHCMATSALNGITGSGTPTSGIYPSYNVSVTYTTSGTWNGTTCTGTGGTTTFSVTIFRRLISQPLAGTDVQTLITQPVMTDAQVGQYLLADSTGQMSASQIAELLAEAIRANYYPSWDELVTSLSDLAAKMDPDSPYYDATAADQASDENSGINTSSGSGAAGEVNIELPTDYNREATQQQILESLTVDTTDAQASIDTAQSDFTAALPTDVGTLGVSDYAGDINHNPAAIGDGVADALTAAGTCTDPTYTLAGHTMDIAVCEFWEPLQPIMAFLAWTMVAIYAFRRVSDVRAG